MHLKFLHTKMFERMFLLLVISFITSLNGFQWRQLAASDLSNGPVGRTSPSNVLYQDAIIMYGGAVSLFP